MQPEHGACKAWMVTDEIPHTSSSDLSSVPKTKQHNKKELPLRTASPETNVTFMSGRLQGSAGETTLCSKSSYGKKFAGLWSTFCCLYIFPFTVKNSLLLLSENIISWLLFFSFWPDGVYFWPKDDGSFCELNRFKAETFIFFFPRQGNLHFYQSKVIYLAAVLFIFFIFVFIYVP